MTLNTFISLTFSNIWSKYCTQYCYMICCLFCLFNSLRRQGKWVDRDHFSHPNGECCVHLIHQRERYVTMVTCHVNSCFIQWSYSYKTSLKTNKMWFEQQLGLNRETEVNWKEMFGLKICGFSNRLALYWFWNKLYNSY